MIVYSRNNCAPCRTLKYYLTKKGIEFEERNVDLNPEFEKELNTLGYASVPVTLIGEKIIVGVNISAIESA